MALMSKSFCAVKQGKYFMNTGMRQMDIATVKAKTAREDWGNVGTIPEI